jgi:CspA family cold shock protein
MGAAHGPQMQQTQGRLTMKGTVKFYDDRGFGFITPEGRSSDIYYHASDVIGDPNDLADGVKVEFEEAPNPKRPGKTLARGVRVVS